MYEEDQFEKKVISVVLPQSKVDLATYYATRTAHGNTASKCTTNDTPIVEPALVECAWSGGGVMSSVTPDK